MNLTKGLLYCKPFVNVVPSIIRRRSTSKYIYELN